MVKEKDNHRGNSVEPALSSSSSSSERTGYLDEFYNQGYSIDNEDMLEYMTSVPEFQGVNMALSPVMKDALQEADRWVHMQSWCVERGLPWKRGWLLYGEPGNGKTSFIRTVAKWINAPVFLFDLSTMDNEEFSNAWKEALQTIPCLVVFEDFDAVFNGRTNIASGSSHLKQGLTFDAILNTIDGVEQNGGILTVITTNNIDKIDPALGGKSSDGKIATRPGRIDRVIHIDRPDEEGRIYIAKRILKGIVEDITEIVKEGENDTGAQFEERCRRKAIDLYWNNPDIIK